MKLLTVIGARPQLIKASAFSKALKAYPQIEEVLVHTGQHYDNDMNQVFLDQLGLPPIQFQLSIDSASASLQSSKMTSDLEVIMKEQQPDLVLVYGDTNSTLAAANAASKLHIPIAHVEAGLRSYNTQMPEETNRVQTDHLSSYLFVPSQKAIDNLRKEGIVDSENTQVLEVGDIMYDVYRNYKAKYSGPQADKKFGLLTIHRQENVDNREVLTELIDSLNRIHQEDIPLICPLHPRAAKQIIAFGLEPKFDIIPPQDYFSMMQLLSQSSIVLTDSGGLQKEAFYASKACINLRTETEWSELEDLNLNKCTSVHYSAIKEALSDFTNRPLDFNHFPYGDGQTAHKIIKALLK